jgi:superoxide dismutase
VFVYGFECTTETSFGNVFDCSVYVSEEQFVAAALAEFGDGWVWMLAVGIKALTHKFFWFNIFRLT